MIDPAELARLFDLHADRLLLVARAIGEPAEDAVQEAFVALAIQTQLPQDPMAWLVTVVRNHLRQCHRSKGRRQDRETVRQTQNWFHWTQNIDAKLDGEIVSAALQKCPSPDREIVVMHLWGEMTFESIGQVIGVSRAKTHRIFQKRMATLQQQFNPQEDDQRVIK